MKALSLSEKPAIKRLFGSKSKMHSKKGKVGMQELSSESDMGI
jgi:hypothetical protein